MAADARGLLAESERLMAQASDMNSSATASLTEAEQMRRAKKEAGKTVARRRRNVVKQ